MIGNDTDSTNDEKWSTAAVSIQGHRMAVSLFYFSGFFNNITGSCW